MLHTAAAADLWTETDCHAFLKINNDKVLREVQVYFFVYYEVVEAEDMERVGTRPGEGWEPERERERERSNSPVTMDISGGFSAISFAGISHL